MATSSESATRARKSHTKSRHGCVQCKTRRVKVREHLWRAPRLALTHPSQVRRAAPGLQNLHQATRNSRLPIPLWCCSEHLTILLRQCAYPGDEPSLPSPRRSSLSPSIQSDQTASKSRHRLELELMYLYATTTRLTINVDDLEPPGGAGMIPRHALDHEYLLHAVFSLTSLHMASLRPLQAAGRIRDAMDYQVAASVACRHGLSNMNAHEVIPLFYCSAVLGMLALAFHSVEDPAENGRRPSDTVIQLSQLWRGTRGVFVAAKSLVDPITYAMMFQPVDLNHSDLTPLLEHQSGAQNFLDDLRPRAQAHAQSEIYTDAIDRAQAGYRMATQDVQAKSILAWIPQVAVEFMDFLAQREPLACAITIAYGVLLRALEKHWWSARFGRDLVEEMSPIALAAYPEWAHHIRWARSR